MTREHLKELLVILASPWDPWIPGAIKETGGFRSQSPRVASKSYTTDANLSCLLPSTLGKFIYLLFISYGGQRGDLKDQGHGNQAIGVGGLVLLHYWGTFRLPQQLLGSSPDVPQQHPPLTKDCSHRTLLPL